MPYRTVSSLRARQEVLEREILAAQEKKTAAAAAASEESRLRRELKETDALLRKLAAPEDSFLDRIRVASPCSADWNKMVGDDRVRFCGQCAKHVYNLSAMSRADAEALVREKEGNLCARMARRADGTVVTNDCPVGAKKKRIQLVILSAAGTAAMGVGMTLAMMTGYKKILVPLDLGDRQMAGAITMGDSMDVKPIPSAEPPKTIPATGHVTPQTKTPQPPVFKMGKVKASAIE